MIQYRVACPDGQTAFLVDDDKYDAEERLEYSASFCKTCYSPGNHRIEQREVGTWKPYGDLTDIDRIAEEEWIAHPEAKIQAIKNIRTRTNAGLKESKDALDRAVQRNPDALVKVSNEDVEEAIASIKATHEKP